MVRLNSAVSIASAEAQECEAPPWNAQWNRSPISACVNAWYSCLHGSPRARVVGVGVPHSISDLGGRMGYAKPHPRPTW
jgi:hypothetical protein